MRSFIDINTMLHFISKGQESAPPVFVLHGLFGTLSNVNGIARALEADYRVIQVDLPNHGLSPNSTEMNYPLMAQMLLDVADQLQLKSFHLVGHSMGGKTAMACALEAPHRVSSVVVGDIAPIAYSSHHRDIFLGLDELWNHPPTSRREADAQLTAQVPEPAIRQFLLKNLEFRDGTVTWRLNYPTVKRCYEHILGWPYHDRQYDGPVLFIKAGNSTYIQADSQAQILAQFPNASAKVIAGTGHWLHAEKPSLFNRLVQGFISQHSH